MKSHPSLAVVALLAWPLYSQTDTHSEHKPQAGSDAQQHVHQHGEMPGMTNMNPELPDLTPAQNTPGPLYGLEQLEQMALAHHPALVQARQATEEARGRQQQSGLYPNPTIGYTGDEIRGGSYAGGKQGFFIEQSVVLGGKLGLNRKIGAEEIRVGEAETLLQRHRILNDVRTAYYRVLASQQMLVLDRQLVQIAQKTVSFAGELKNVGQADDTEVLEAEVEQQRREMAVIIETDRLRGRWMMLTSAIGELSLPRGTVQGDLRTAGPGLDEDKLLASLLQESPQVKIAQADLSRAEAALARARRERIPDLIFRGGLQQDNEPIGPQRSVGVEGFAEVGLRLRLWDRNQGATAAAEASAESARAEMQRVELLLRNQFAGIAQNYRNARTIAERYRGQILPRLRRSYIEMTTQYGLMLASFPRVLNLQRGLFEAEADYLAALEVSWTSDVALRGFLLQGGLEFPGNTAPVISEYPGKLR